MKNKNILYRSDCKLALQKLLSENIKVDLIYLDPPFKSNRIYSMIFTNDDRKKTAQQIAFNDMWNFNHEKKILLDNINQALNNSKISNTFKIIIQSWIDAFYGSSEEDKKLLNYLLYMTERLILMRNILKKTATIYLHCDSTAVHYLKIVMDGIFGSKNFRNEIIWKRTSAHSNVKKLGIIDDRILVYAKNENLVKFNPVYTKYSEEYLRKFYRHKDNKGFYSLGDLGAPLIIGYPYKYKGYKPPLKGWRCPKKTMEKWDSQGLIYFPKDKNKRLRFKRYLNIMKGVPLQTIWGDIDPISDHSKEKIGYPTQKPLKLLERIVKMSSDENDLILDPFCGCGTSIAAAAKLGRKWIGIDISGDAIEIIKKRFLKEAIVEKDQYSILEGNPETMCEYNRLNPYEKQDWLIRRIGGFPNPKKSSDGGVDGDMKIHLGFDKKEKDIWGKIIFSVKTGKQCNPSLIREVAGTMKKENAIMAGLILDTEPTDGMKKTADSYGKISYSQKKEMPPSTYYKVQLLTAQNIIDDNFFKTPPPMKNIYDFRKQKENQEKKGYDLFFLLIIIILKIIKKFIF